jgi:alkaline phosphatase D
MKRLLPILTACLAFYATSLNAQTHLFQSDWPNTPDRIWIGPEYWANPMEDWRIENGRLECVRGAANRNVHLLTQDTAYSEGTLEMEVRVGKLTGNRVKGSAGFRIGIQDEINDYRARCIKGKGINVGLTHDGFLFIDKSQTSKPIPEDAIKDLLLVLRGETRGNFFLLSVEALNVKTRSSYGFHAARLKDTQIHGNLALVNNHTTGKARYWFRDWKVSGSKLQTHADHAWGPILWTMHTLHHSKQGHVLKLTAQMPPLGETESAFISLQYQENGQWTNGQSTEIDPLSRTATWRIPNWNANTDHRYRVVYGKDEYTGVIRRDPVEKDAVVVAGFTGNQDTGFPNLEITKNVGIQDPDVLFFSGDQIYEGVGGYGIIRDGVERPVLNYLRKWYLLGWSFGDLMRDRVTICLPDDHDVYQGNIWGEGGAAMQGGNTSTDGGYIQHPDFINAVHRTQTSHHPDIPDPKPILQNITPFHGHMVYGRVSFALIADRMFKTGPQAVATWEGRADHLKDPAYDVTQLDKPELELLGRRQEKFLEDWVQDWRGADFKSLLSQTIFVNLANYHGAKQEFIYADLDSNGWPQTPRNRALSILRKGYAFHYAGDQHLPSVTRNGVDTWNDAGYAFCVPSIAAGYPRSWRPDQEGRSFQNQVIGENTGEYRDAFGNLMTVWAIGNPEKEYRSGRINTLHDKSSGYGIVRFNKNNQTIDMECYRLQIDAKRLKPGDQFPGWPLRIHLTDNDGRKPIGFLTEFEVKSVKNAVVKVYDESDGNLVYAMRIQGNRFRPWVFSEGSYKVHMGDPDTDQWKTWENQKIQP